MSSARFLAVDPGGKKVGLALADQDTGVVSPLCVITYEGCSRTSITIREIAEKNRAATIVVGLPTDSEGNETAACRRSHALADALREQSLQVELEPEHLSTNEARRRARTLGRARTQPVDDLAAQVVLEDFLWRKQRENEPSCESD